LFEGVVATLLRAWNDYEGLYDSMSYWAPTEGSVEVDFLLQRGKRCIAIEVKSGKTFRSDDLTGLKAIGSLAGVERRMVVYRQVASMKTQEGIEVLSFEKLVDLLTTRRL
jgi:predicted AAA+ superfamily ATPase